MRLKITAVRPFDFGMTAMIFSNEDKEIRRYESGVYWQVLRVGGKLILVFVTFVGTVEKPILSVEVKSGGLISGVDKRVIVETVCSLFNLGLNLNEFYEDVKGDGVMLSLTRRLRGLRSPSTPSVFEALIDSIIEQQISLAVARSIEGRVVKAFGDSLEDEGEIYYAFPTSQSLAVASVKRLRECGLSLRKAEYIKNVSGLVEKGDLDLEALKDCQDSDEIVRELDRVRGIGVWTAELTIVRGMQRFDVIPADDLGVRRCISHYYCGDGKISGEEARMIAKKWGRWKGLASFYLIVAKSLRIEI
jgi:DNA-3-methyladenine glycosylase II